VDAIAAWGFHDDFSMRAGRRDIRSISALTTVAGARRFDPDPLAKAIRSVPGLSLSRNASVCYRLPGFGIHLANVE
jgi:hypothetical protein